MNRLEGSIGDGPQRDISSKNRELQQLVKAEFGQMQATGREVKVKDAGKMDCSLSVHGILQARILEWVAISFSMGSSQPRD